MRQSLFRRLRPIPPNNRQIGFFFDGARRHEALQELYTNNDPVHAIAEKKGNFEGVNYSIDIYQGFPIEFKTTNANKGISSHWLRQNIYYMLASEAKNGILQIQRKRPKKNDNNFPAYLLELDENQRQYWLNDFRERKDLFLKAVETSDPSILPVYRGEDEWKSGMPAWTCDDCTYLNECNEIESKAGRPTYSPTIRRSYSRKPKTEESLSASNIQK